MISPRKTEIFNTWIFIFVSENAALLMNSQTHMLLQHKYTADRQTKTAQHDTIQRRGRVSKEMPHRRKNKKNFCPQLQFDQQDSYLYLSYSEEEDSSISVSLDTFVIIFSIKFCEIKNIKIR